MLALNLVVKVVIKKQVGRGVNVTSWLVGTAAQASANPQQYVKHFLENITDEMKFMHTVDGDEVLDLLDGKGGINMG